MKTITLRLASEEKEDVLTQEDLSVLNERLELYRSNPSTGKDLEEVNQILKQKYGV